MADIQEQVRLLKKDIEVSIKTNNIEFDRIGIAFSKLGKLVDLLYLQVAVLLELLTKNKTITEENFAKQLEETAKKMEKQVKDHIEKMRKPGEKNLASSLNDETKK